MKVWISYNENIPNLSKQPSSTSTSRVPRECTSNSQVLHTQSRVTDTTTFTITLDAPYGFAQM